jgi:hypothetical protein
MDATTGIFMLYGAACLVLMAAGVGAWLFEKLGESERRREPRPSRVWVFNNMPAGAMVDTEVSCAPVSFEPRRAAR